MKLSEICKLYNRGGTYRGDISWQKLGLSIQTDKTIDEFIVGINQHNRVVAFIRKMASKSNFERFFHSNGDLDYYGVLHSLETGIDK